VKKKGYNNLRGSFTFNRGGSF